MTTDNYLRNYAIKITEHLKSLFQDLKNIDHFLRGWGGWGSPQLLFNLANFFSPGQTLYSLLSDFPCQVPPPLHQVAPGTSKILHKSAKDPPHSVPHFKNSQQNLY